MIIFHKSNVPWLVLWNIFIFHILGIIIPTDFHIFQRGWNHQAEMFVVQSTYCCSNYFTVNSKKTLDQVNQAPIVDVVFDKSHNSTTLDQFPTFPNCGCLGYNPRVFSTFLEANLSGCLRQSLSQSGLCLAASGEVTDLDHRLTSYLGNLYIFTKSSYLVLLSIFIQSLYL